MNDEGHVIDVNNLPNTYLGDGGRAAGILLKFDAQRICTQPEAQERRECFELPNQHLQLHSATMSLTALGYNFMASLIILR